MGTAKGLGHPALPGCSLKALGPSKVGRWEERYVGVFDNGKKRQKRGSLQVLPAEHGQMVLEGPLP